MYSFWWRGKNESVLVPANGNWNIVGIVGALYFWRHPEPVSAINTKDSVSALPSMFGYFVEFIVLSPETKKQDPRSDLRHNNQLHRIVANPKGLFPSLILYFICFCCAGPDNFLHVYAPPDSQRQIKSVYLCLLCIPTTNHGIESSFPHLSLRQLQ